MKKILAVLTAITMSLGLCISANPILAANETTGIIYYNVEKLVVADINSLPQGAYYLSTNGTLADPTFMSAKFPSTLDANVMVTGPLDTSTNYYGKDKGDSPYNIDGYPVNVIKRDSMFDGCDEGHLFAPANKKDANGVQLWMYYCNYGGAQDVGPYYLYSVKSTTYTSKDVSVKVLKDFSKSEEKQVVTKDDLEVTINITIDGKVVPFVTKDFEVDAYNNTVDPITGFSDITINLEGESEYTYLVVDVTIPLDGMDEVEKPVETPKQDSVIKETGALSETSNAMLYCSIAILSGCAVVFALRNRASNKS